MKNFIKVFSLFVLLLFVSSAIVANEKRNKRLDNLILQTKVLKITATPTGENLVNIVVEIENTFTNKGEEPIIILQPYNQENGEDTPIQYVGISLKTKNEGQTWESPVYSSIYTLPSFCGDCESELEKKLDEKLPPQKLTLVLKKDEFWKWKTKITFSLQETGKTYNYDANWEEINKLETKIIARVSYSMFPTNVRNSKKIKKRWGKIGLLYYFKTHSIITSEPFELDLKGLKRGNKTDESNETNFFYDDFCNFGNGNGFCPNADGKACYRSYGFGGDVGYAE